MKCVLFSVVLTLCISVSLARASDLELIPQEGSSWKQDQKLWRIESVGKIPKDPVRRPAAVALIQGSDKISAMGSYQLTLEAKSLDLQKKGADVVLVWDFVAPNVFQGADAGPSLNYAHLSNDSDGKVHSVLMRVDGEQGKRWTFHQEEKPIAALKEGWLRLDLIRDAQGVRVYVDDPEQQGPPALSAKDLPPSRPGLIGFGSFNDRAEFRNLSLKKMGSTQIFSSGFEPEEGRVPVSGGQVSGILGSKQLTENSSWTNNPILYEVRDDAAFEGNYYQRMTLKEGTRLELLQNGLPAGPGRFFKVKVALRSKDQSETNLVYSNTSNPKSGGRWMTRWSVRIPLTPEWQEVEFVMPDLHVEDELRFGFNLGQPGSLDLDAFSIELIDEEEALKRVRANAKPVTWEAQQQDGRRTGDAPALPWPVSAEATAADLKGPDGHLYPDWRYAGIPGGIPEREVTHYAKDFGAVVNDGKADTTALKAALDQIGEAGGGVLQLEEGTYILDRPLKILHDNLVLRGAGSDKTHFVFTYSLDPAQIRFLDLDPGQTLGWHDVVEVHAYPHGLKKLELFVGDTLIRDMSPGQHTPGQFWIIEPMFLMGQRGAKIQDGPMQLRARARWEDGSVSETTLQVIADTKKRKAEGQIRYSRNPGAIDVPGDRWTYRGRRWKLAQDVKRGDTQVHFEVEPVLQVGELLKLSVPKHEDFLNRVQSARKDIPRAGIFIVEAVDGKTVTLNQPARMDYPAYQGARGETVYHSRNIGLESFSLEQTNKLWIHGLLMQNSYLSWIRDVKVNMAGRNPVDIGGSKNSEVRDSEFNDAWYLGGGGTGYVSVSSSHDCLMEQIHTRRLRHAPNAQWGAQGNVIRNSVFEQSDAQFHMGWALENLYENCIVDAATGSGSYGYALYVQEPEVEIHGPGGGPRNVMYNNDFRSPKSGVYLGGSNEGWMLLHNRFLVSGGAGMIFRHRVFNLRVEGNHIQVSSAVEPAFEFRGDGHVNVELLNNVISSRSGLLFKGSGWPEHWQGNKMQLDGKPLPRPAPQVPSIFEWQRKTYPLNSESD